MARNDHERLSHTIEVSLNLLIDLMTFVYLQLKSGPAQLRSTIIYLKFCSNCILHSVTNAICVNVKCQARNAEVPLSHYMSMTCMWLHQLLCFHVMSNGHVHATYATRLAYKEFG